MAGPDRAGHRMVYEDPAMCLVTCGRAFINAWFRAPDVGMLKRLYAYHRPFVRSLGGRHAVVSLIEANIGRTLSADAREEARIQAQEMVPLTYCHAFVILGTGFDAATVRSIIAGVQMVSRTPVPWRVFADIPTAAGWVADQGVREGFAEVAEALVVAVEAAHGAASRASGVK